MSVDGVIPYRHFEIPSTYIPMFTVRTIVNSRSGVPQTIWYSSVLFMFLCSPHFSPMTSPALQAKKKKKERQRKQGHILVVCISYCAERWTELMKDTHSFLAWRHHKRPIVDVFLCAFPSARDTYSRISLFCWITDLKKKRVALWLCVHLCLVWVLLYAFVVLF